MIKIIKPTTKQTIAAIKSRDFSEVDKIKESTEKDARKVFDAVTFGSALLIWYDLPPVRCQSGAVSFQHQTASISLTVVFLSSSGTCPRL